MTDSPSLLNVPSLLDVNVLLALADPRHIHHETAHEWFEKAGTFATTPLTEVGFARLMSHPKVGGETAGTALELLRQIRAVDGHVFLPDDSSLTDPVFGAGVILGHQQMTGLHLVNLAARHLMKLVTFDARLHRSLPDTGRRHVVVIDA